MKNFNYGNIKHNPDSFSDGGKYNNLDAALEQAAGLIADGADIRCWWESTRPLIHSN